MKALTSICAVAVMIAACGNPVKNAGVINQQASLPSAFNFESLGLKVMASFINKKAGTMCTLYANPLALQHARSGSGNHSAGEVFALVTWKQQADDRWFGAKIPADLSLLELVRSSTLNRHTVFSYEKREGQMLTSVTDTLGRQARLRFILEQQPSIMP